MPDLTPHSSVPVDEAVRSAVEASQIVNSNSAIAALLEGIASGIEGLGDALIETACEESNLPVARLTGERGRTTGQLRMFAGVAREGSWVDARIDEAQPDRKPLPRSDIRSMLMPIGPVGIFGASNFPLAFSTAGGDTASALAAGCPVIVKAHPAHLKTHAMIASVIHSAVQKADLHPGTFQSVDGGIEVGSALVQAPGVKAVAFTGSFGGGTALWRLANERDEPIPVFAEMGSVNPVFFLPGVLAQKRDEMAKGYVASLTMGVGQFCTNPGLVVGLAGGDLLSFLDQVVDGLKSTILGKMLTPSIEEAFVKSLDLVSQSAETIWRGGPGVPTALLKVTAQEFMENPGLQHEMFGPAALVVVCRNEAEMRKVAEVIGGQLTATIWASESDRPMHQALASILARKAGRVVTNGYPTGVEVGDAMQHGGPFPATTDSRFTSVGTRAILRFARPVCFQDFPDDLLPDALKASNPLKIERLVNGLSVR